MPVKIKKQELANLQSKITLYNMTINPKTKQGDMRLYMDFQRYAKLLLHRHRCNVKTHQVNPETGLIHERELKGEEQVQAEIEEHL